MCFQHFKIGDLEALEKENAYPPRFFLTLRNFGSIQHLSTVICAIIKNNAEEKKQLDCDNIKTLTFPIHTMDYEEFKMDKSPLPSGKQLLAEGAKELAGTDNYIIYHSGVLSKDFHQACYYITS